MEWISRMHSIYSGGNAVLQFETSSVEVRSKVNTEKVTVMNVLQFCFPRLSTDIQPRTDRTPPHRCPTVGEEKGPT